MTKLFCPSVSDWTLLACWIASELLTFFTEFVRVMIASVPVATELLLLLW